MVPATIAFAAYFLVLYEPFSACEVSLPVRLKYIKSKVIFLRSEVLLTHLEFYFC